MRFVQGIDYGRRQGSLGISFHMSEGGDELASYLSQRAGETAAAWRERIRGVSCNAALLSTGEIVQMLPWDHASGNLNPADRAGEYGYFGHRYLVDVLGDHWPDPNTWTVSMEIAGRRAVGPTPQQVDAAIDWARSMRAIFPTIRGSIGHHDQSPKGCPGTSPAMLSIYAAIGGHGLFTEDPDVATPIPVGNLGPFSVLLSAGDQLYDEAFQPTRTVPGPETWPGLFYTGNGYIGIEHGGRLAFVRTNQAVVTRPPASDCDRELAELKAATGQAVTILGGTPPAP